MVDDLSYRISKHHVNLLAYFTLQATQWESLFSSPVKSLSPYSINNQFFDGFLNPEFYPNCFQSYNSNATYKYLILNYLVKYKLVSVSICKKIQF